MTAAQDGQPVITRLPVVEAETGTDEQRDALIEWGKDRGQTTRPSDIFGMLVASPEAMRRVGKLGAFARLGTELPPIPREAGVLSAVSQRGYGFEINLHVKNLQALGVADDVIDAIRQGRTDDLPEGAREAARLAWAMASGGIVPQDVFDDAHRIFGDRGVVELAVVIAYFAMLSDLANTFWPGG